MNAVKELKKEEKKADNSKMVISVKPAEVQEKAKNEEIAKTHVENFMEKHKPEAPKSAESRIDRMKQFEALSTRYNLLKEKDNELKTFQAGNDKLGAKIIFKNAQGFEFSVQILT